MESLDQVRMAADRAAKLTQQLLTFGRKQFMQMELMDINEIIQQVTQMLRRVLGENVSLRSNLAAAPAGHRGRRDDDGAGHHESLGQRPRRHARRRLAHHRHGAGDGLPRLRRAQPRGARGNVRLPLRQRQRHRHRARQTQQAVRAILHHQGSRQGNRAWDSRPCTASSSSTRAGSRSRANSARAPSSRCTSPHHHKAVQARNGKVAPQNVRGGKETVLLVEDEAGVLTLARGILKSYGYDVLEARSGVEALRLWAQHDTRIDLLLTDIVMPEGMSGLDLAKKLRAGKTRPQGPLQQRILDRSRRPGLRPHGRHGVPEEALPALRPGAEGPRVPGPARLTQDSSNFEFRISNFPPTLPPR